MIARWRRWRFRRCLDAFAAGYTAGVTSTLDALAALDDAQAAALRARMAAPGHTPARL